MNTKDQNCFIVDIAIPRDSRLSEREGNKVEKYLDLNRVIIKNVEFEQCSGNINNNYW